MSPTFIRTTIAAAFAAGAILLATVAALDARAKPIVTYTSECSCSGNHGVSRWTAKTDLAEPPSNHSDIQAITPAGMAGWKGPGGNIDHDSGRVPDERKWYAMTGQLTRLRIEDDGDLHMILTEAEGDIGKQVVVEVPLGSRWCDIRKQIFSWTDAKFPLKSEKTQLFHLLQKPVITVTGKAFYDIDHSGKSTETNRRDYAANVSVWEIHPVMKLEVLRMDAEPPAATPTATPDVTAAPSPFATATPPVLVTITQSVTIRIPYGTTVLPRGMRLPLVSHDELTAHVRYMDQVQTIPISATDLR